MKKLLVFGLDGVPLGVLEAYARAHPDGLFAAWLQRGHVRTLLATLPCFTAPSWTTFMTGLDPGHHGLYHWRGRHSMESGRRPLLSSEHLAEASFWWYCQQHGRRVSVSNFPMEYPAPPTDGRYICGTLAPESAPNVTWPPRLIDELRAAIPGYRFEMDKGLSYVDRPAELRAHILEVGQGHALALKQFADARTVDLLVHVVTVTDRMEHFFWHCFDAGHPDHASSPRDLVGNPIFEACALAEDALRDMWEQGGWDNVVVLSDHGMGPSFTSFHTDAWLVENGFAALGDDGDVAVSASLAYSGEEPECAIYVNRLGRDGVGVDDASYDDLVARLVGALTDLRLPGTGAPAFEEVLPQRRLYAGIAAEIGPDLVLVPAPGVHPRPGPAPRVFDRSTRLVGGHRRAGLFLGFGADFAPRPSAATGAPLHMRDMFPLLCALMELPIPAGLSGMVPSDCLARSTAAPVHDPTWDWRRQVRELPRAQSAESAPLLARLAELGYVR
jgi:predicted AlkP superfamily phosphohydrolase/phosphomutase